MAHLRIATVCDQFGVPFHTDDITDDQVRKHIIMQDDGTLGTPIDPHTTLIDGPTDDTQIATTAYHNAKGMVIRYDVLVVRR